MRFLTAGESHGKALVGVLEGMPSGIEISVKEIQHELIRRKQGYGRGDRQNIENEDLQILSGVRAGKTLGSPISILIPNQDWKNWEHVMSIDTASDERCVHTPRPGHADYVGAVKYQHRDMRNVLERASARETAMRVAIAVVAKKFLKHLNVEIKSHVVEIGGNDNPEVWDELIRTSRDEGNTLGGIFSVEAIGVAVGLGSYAQWDRRIEGVIAKAFMSLNAIKGVEIGEGVNSARLKGSEAHDEIILNELTNEIQYKTNRSGGITGGMTTGETIFVRASMKPLSTLKKPLRSVSFEGKPKSSSAHFERSDVCAVHSAAVIGESLLALVLTEAYLEKFGGDSIGEIKERVEQWKKAKEIFL